MRCRNCVVVSERREVDMELQTGKIIEFNIESNHVSEEGQTQIRHYLAQTTHYLGLPLDWNWRWNIAAKGEYVGRLPTRISKYYKLAYSAKLDTETLSELGNIARAHTCAGAKYYFDFDQELAWRDGDFGDDGSCYWGGKHDAREMLRDHGAYAIRFYHQGQVNLGLDGKDTTVYTGYGRAWLVPWRDCFVAFNSYGQELSTVSFVLARYLKRHYQRIELFNNDKTRGMLWINGGTGYAIGKSEIVKEWTYIDLRWPVPLRCRECGEITDQPYYAESDKVLCLACFDRMYAPCADCSRAILAYGARRLSTGEPICWDCSQERGRDPSMYLCAACDEPATSYCVNCDQYLCRYHAH